MGEKKRKATRQSKRSGPGRRRVLISLAKWSAVGAIWVGFAGLLFLGWGAFDLPDVSTLNDVKKQPRITLLAADGSLISSYGDLYGAFVHLDQMSGYLPAAVVATEDRRFYRHHGI